MPCLIVVFASLLVVTLTANAQQPVTGLVQNESGVPVSFANATLYTAGDSTLASGAASDADGLFTINVKPGEYFLKITFIAYKEKILPGIVVTTNPVNLGTIVLEEAPHMLETVVVEGERSQLELHLDKRVFQVGKDLSNISGSATDILDNVPSVTVDGEGNISLRGSQNVKILIDGRPSGLTGINTADALRQLQGNLIESVEVITNPSARYDAEGEVGIINIILKKERKQGLNGSVSANAGHPDNYGTSFSLNFRKEKLNFFGSYGFSYRSGPGYRTSYQSFTEADTTFSYRQYTNMTRNDRSHTLRAGLDYHFNNQNMLTGSFILRRSNNLNKSTNDYRDVDSQDRLVRNIIRSEREKEPETNSEIALSYRKEYNRPGQLLTADFKWIENIETENSTLSQLDKSIDSIGYQRSHNTENERNVLTQVDYIHPFGAKGKVEIGLKSTLRVIDNDFTVEQQDPEAGTWSILPQFNNNLIYRENIHAAYVIAGNETGKFSWQTGLRGELSDIAVELKETDETTYQHYFNLFPSAHLSYSFSSDRSIQLSYSYRLSRPRFRDLTPFSNYSDNRSVFTGNPNLRPEYTHSLEAGYLINSDAMSLLSSAYYRYRTGVVERIALIDSIGFTRQFPVNLSSENAFGLEFNVSWNPVKWWRFNSNANFYRAITDGVFEGQVLSSDTYTWTNRTTSRITFFEKWQFQVGFNYRAPRNTPQGKDLHTYFIDLGLSRDLLKGNGTVTLTVRDLMNSRKFRSILDRPDEGYYSETISQQRVRQLLLTFTYRINSKKESKQDDAGDDDDDGDF